MPRTMTTFAVAVVALALVGGLATPADAAPKKPARVGAISVTHTTKTTISVKWSKPKRAKRYEIVVADNKRMTKGRAHRIVKKRTFKIRNREPGEIYYVKVRALRDDRKGTFSKKLRVRTRSATISVRSATFNVCGIDAWCSAVRPALAPWATRQHAAGKVARALKADVLAVQEDRSADFEKQLPTMVLAGSRGYVSLYYRGSRFEQRAAGTFVLPGGKVGSSKTAAKYAVWARLRDKVTHTDFIAVSTHLQPFKGRAYDAVRFDQTIKLIEKVKAINVARRPVVIAGDLNSSADNAQQSKYEGGFDAPTQAFGSARYVDARDAADATHHADYNSFHQTVNPPIREGNHLDHLFTSPGIRTASWSVAINLSGGANAIPFASDHSPVKAKISIAGYP
ncbi:hypothetical protein BH09ACT10_BH09ACT10_23880 [soil metagenome]